MRDFVHLQSANDIALFLDDSFRKVAPQELPDVDSNRIAVLELRGRTHRRVTHHDGTIRFDHFQLSHSLIVIAENLQHHITAGARGKQNIVRFQPTRVVRHHIFRFGGLELEPAAQRARAPAQIA